MYIMLIECVHRRILKVETKPKQESRMGAGIALGLVIGMSIGLLLGNIAYGIPLGIAVGAGIGVWWDQQRNMKDGSD